MLRCADAPAPPRAQHEVSDGHVHFLSPDLITLWKGLGIPFSKADHFYANIDSIMALSGAKRMKLISMAYVFSSAEFGGGKDEAYAAMKHENNYLAALKSKYPAAITAFYGIDPLHEHALEEIARCHHDLQLDGIKLHFNASQVYLTEKAHLAKAKEVFRYASENRLPLLLHFDNGHRKFGAPDVQILADSILAELDFADLQIAHFGTSGGFGQRTKAVLDAFCDLYERNHPATRHRITFDISAVCLDKDSDGASKLTRRGFAELAEYARKIGFDKIVFGTDYPLYNTQEYLDLLKAKLKLTDNELEAMLADK